jgi:hypothetical protein
MTKKDGDPAFPGREGEMTRLDKNQPHKSRLDEIEKWLKQTKQSTVSNDLWYRSNDIVWLTQRLRETEKKLDDIDDDLHMASNETVDYIAWAIKAREDIGELLKSIRGEK